MADTEEPSEEEMERARRIAISHVLEQFLGMGRVDIDDFLELHETASRTEVEFDVRRSVTSMGQMLEKMGNILSLFRRPEPALAAEHLELQLAMLDRLGKLVPNADVDDLAKIADVYLTLPSVGDDSFDVLSGQFPWERDDSGKWRPPPESNEVSWPVDGLDDED